MWKVLNLLQKTTQYFEKKEIPHPRASSEILLASVLGCSRTDLYVRFNEFVNDSKLDQYRLLVERRAKNEPVAYITGHREFWSLDFDVGPGVLIPRPETEHLVEEALKIFKGRDNWSSFELGLGSGIISVSLAQECEGARLVGADISEEALIYARRNATKHGVSIDIRLGSGFDVLKEGEKFDL
ncbi:MAG: peptide chain release factor N(5)-glutamine methyltransferase, partial [Deltaproteobacteria bacterium]|nr:peptide chain release factor N(5)-glutamine methyltransferase [Deltaproteobacteria bacterium]